MHPIMRGPSDRLQDHWPYLKEKTAEREEALRKKINGMEKEENQKRREAEPQRRSSLDLLDDDKKDQEASASKMNRREKRKNKKKKSASGSHKRRKKSTESEYERFVKICEALADSKTQDELYQYEKNPMVFWKLHKKILPNAFKVAKRTFVIPASSTSAERVFKLSKRNRSASRGNKSHLKNEQEIILGSYLRMIRE